MRERDRAKTPSTFQRVYEQVTANPREVVVARELECRRRHHDVLIKQCVQPMEVGRRIVESPRAPLLREPAFVTSAVAL